MHDSIIDNSFEVVGDVQVRCDSCGHHHIFNKNSCWEETWSEESNMGDRTEYKYSFEDDCKVCGNQLSLIIRFSEYPAGSGSMEGEPDIECNGCKMIGKAVNIEYVNIDYSLILDSPYIPTIIHRDGHDQQSNSSFVLADGKAMVYDKTKNDYPNSQLTIKIPANQRLLEILVDETRTIHFDNNRAVFAYLIRSDPKRSAMNLLGRVAEAEIVRRCRSDDTVNEKWLAVARKGFSIYATMEKFIPIGTGLHSTKRCYPQKYDPLDTQRDIIWIDKNQKVVNMVNSTAVSGLQAGLQVKTSTDGEKYVQPDLETHRYEVPVVYFPVNNDFDKIVDNLKRKEKNGLISPIKIGVDFVNALTVDKIAHDAVVMEYYPLIMRLFDGRISADDFVKEASGYVPMKNAILAGTLEQRASKIILLR